MCKELEEIKGQLRQAQQNFDYADDEFIDAAIYELKATEEKFAAMLREKKKERERGEKSVRPKN